MRKFPFRRPSGLILRCSTICIPLLLQGKQAATSLPCGWHSMKSTMSVCTICFNLICAPSQRDVLLIECVTTVLEMLTSKVSVRVCRNRRHGSPRWPKAESKVQLCFLLFVMPDLRWINIQTLGEASKLLQFGNKNRSAAATKMNQSSSRRQTFH